MEIFLGWIIFSLAVGAIGVNRNIGFAGAFFLSLFLSPVIGLIFTLVSKSDEQLKFETELLSHTKKQTDGILNAGHKSFTDELFKLKTLLDSGLISREEFESEKESLGRNAPIKKTVLALYCSQTPSMSGTLMLIYFLLLSDVLSRATYLCTYFSLISVSILKADILELRPSGIGKNL